MLPSDALPQLSRLRRMPTSSQVKSLLTTTYIYVLPESYISAPFSVFDRSAHSKTLAYYLPALDLFS